MQMWVKFLIKTEYNRYVVSSFVKLIIGTRNYRKNKKEQLTNIHNKNMQK